MLRIDAKIISCPLVLLAWVTLVTPTSFAEEFVIYRCEDERGRLALSDRPCGEDLEFVALQTIKTKRTSSRPSPKPAQQATDPVQERIVANRKKKNCERQLGQEDSPWINTFEDDC